MPTYPHDLTSGLNGNLLNEYLNCAFQIQFQNDRLQAKLLLACKFKTKFDRFCRDV
jgi:hypothetical protein